MSYRDFIKQAEAEQAKREPPSRRYYRNLDREPFVEIGTAGVRCINEDRVSSVRDRNPSRLQGHKKARA